MKTIPLDRLKPSAQNARRQASDAGIAELAASIAAHGLLQNLVVRPDPAEKGAFVVDAGGRRLAALRRLAADGRIPHDHPVPCQVIAKPDATGLEASLAENVLREAMPPLDEMEAFVRLLEAGADVAAIAQRFGTTERHVEARLRLGRLAEPIRDALRAGQITLDHAKAFARTTDQDRQAAAVARFVGLDAYAAAGGRLERDLFAEDEDGTLLDTDLIDRLADAKLAEAAATVRAEGWAWVEAVRQIDHSALHKLGRVYPSFRPDAETEARLSAIEDELAAIEETAETEEREYTDAEIERIETLEAQETDLRRCSERYDPVEIAHAGAVVGIDREGRLEIRRGLVQAADKRPLAAALAARAAGEPEPAPTETTGTTGTTGDAGQPGAPPSEPRGDRVDPDGAGSEANTVTELRLSQSLTESLAQARTDVLRAHLAEDPATAFDLLLFALCSRVFGAWGATGLSLSVGGGTWDGPGKTPSLARQRLGELHAELDLRWLEAPTAERFPQLRALDFDAKQRLLAFAVAQLVEVQFGLKPIAVAPEQAAVDMGLDVRSLWTPDGEGFFARVPKAAILRALADCGGEAFARANDGLRKDALVAFAERFFAGEARHLSPEAAAAAAAWAPPGMGFRVAETPGGADAALVADASAEDPETNPQAEETIAAA